MRKNIIVGFDPGTTTGIAILDTEGNVLTVISKRNIGIKKVVEIISKFGNPIIVATDVNPPPKTVEKLSHIFGSRLFYPSESLNVTEKEELVSEFSPLIKDTHQRDSLASCLKAYNHYKNFFKKVKKILKETQAEHLYDEVVAKALRSGTKNIASIVKDLTTKEEEEKKTKKRRRKIPPEVKNLIKSLRELVEKQKSEIRRLKDDIKLLQEKLKHQHRPTDKKFRKKVEVLKEKISALENAFSLVGDIRRFEKNGFIPVLNLEKVKRRDIEILSKFLDLDDVWLYTNDREDFLYAERKKFGGVITSLKQDEIDDSLLSIPIVFLKLGEKTGKKEIFGISKEILNNLKKNVRKRRFLKWLEKYRKRKEI